MSSYSEYADSVARIIQSGAAAQADAQRQRGAIWGNAISGLGQLVANVPGQIAEQQRLKNQSALTGLELQKATREQQQQDALKTVLQKHNGDFEAALPELSAIDPKLGLEIGTRLNQSKIATLDYQQRQFKAERDKVDWLHEQIGSATDDASYLQALHTVKNTLGPEAIANVPPQYDSKTVEQYNQAALTAKERLDARFKTVDDERKALQLMLDEQRKTDAERRLEQNTAADNARADQQLKISQGQLALGQRREGREASQAKAQDAPLNLTPEGLDVAAMNYMKTGQLPPLGMGDKVTRKAIINRAAELGAGAQPRSSLDLASNRAGFAADEGSLKTLQKSRDAISAFENTALKNIDIFLATAGKVVDTGSPLANTPARALSGKVLGSPDQAAYEAARQVALNEVAKITSNPTLSGQLSDSARKEVESFNPNSATLKQSVAVMRVLKQDMANRAASYDQQLAEIKGRISGKPAAPPAVQTTPAPSGGAPTYQDYLRSRGQK